jgi:hypothetical protein
MNMCQNGDKNICKNGANDRLLNDISFKSPKVPVNSVLFGLFMWVDSDKESSHVVGKFSHSRA